MQPTSSQVVFSYNTASGTDGRGGGCKFSVELLPLRFEVKEWRKLIGLCPVGKVWLIGGIHYGLKR